MRTHWIILLAFLMTAAAAAQTRTNTARRVPPPGLPIPENARTELATDAALLGREIESLPAVLKDQPKLAALLPDVQVFHKAVHWALAYDEFYRSNDVATAKRLIDTGLKRAKLLREGQAPWISATGLVVRGYISKLDGSVQPYGLVVPPSFAVRTARKHRLDVWLHGRDNNLSELKFISDRQRSAGEFAPPDTFVLHPYGRYCNAFKFAGEVDVFEALEHARKHYPIDGNRLAIRGFSMGGAGCWHLAAHHAGFWAAAAPGAGFAETADYTKVLSKEPKPAWYEQTLWHLYDATDYAGNLFHCPTIAYSGELDKQKQAADQMSQAMAAEHLELTHLIGPKTDHKYEPQTKVELSRRFDAIMAKGRDSVPRQIRFTTWTLRYNRLGWVTVDGLEKHWERAHVEAELLNSRTVQVDTTNVSALTLTLPAAFAASGSNSSARLDGQTVRLKESGHATAVHFRKQGHRWIQAASADDGALRKRHGLQGPIDDAFMDSFIMVRPTGPPLNAPVGAWVAAALTRATNDWRAQFRGYARVTDDTAITDADLMASNLILWGDPRSNRLLAKMAAKLPIRWDGQQVRLGAKTFSAEQHVPVLIFPNPLNPKRYVVLNSGFTFAAYGDASNAMQTPKLPDFAVIDIGAPTGGRSASGVVHAGFFGERWELAEAGQ